VKALTRLERRALGLASNQAGASIVVARKHIDGSKDVTRALANRLVLRGLAAITGERLRITHEGQRVLKAPLPEGPPVYLASGGGAKYATTKTGRQVEITEGDDLTDHGYTTLRHRASDDLETMNPDLLRPDWGLRAEAHRKLCRADLDSARLTGLDHPEERLRVLRKMAAEKGTDVSDELRFVERGLKALERKVRRDAA
jgi:hypothetical protein